MNIKFIRVLGLRSQSPSVLADADGHLVNWTIHGWTCTCPPDQFPECPHIEAVANLLDPRVTGEPATP